MKNFVRILWAVFILSIYAALSSCSADLDYKKACEEKDWTKAYSIVDRLENEMRECSVEVQKNWGSSAYGKSEQKYKNAQASYNGALYYVVLQEAIVTLEEQGEKGIMRIVGIAKEHHAEDWLYKELLDVAKKIGDEGLAERFQEIMDNE